MNNIIDIDRNEKIKTIPSTEVAKMMGKEHWEVLRMLEGYEPPKGSKSRKVIGIIPTLTDHNVVVSDYFIEVLRNLLHFNHLLIIVLSKLLLKLPMI